MQILSRIEHGDPLAADELLPLVYQELRNLAARRLMREKPGQTLQATALVHEAYLRLIGTEDVGQWNSRQHFFAAASEAMRRILVERARQRQRLKYGGNFHRQELVDDDLVAVDRIEEILDVDAALNELAKHDPRSAELVKLRFFLGMTSAEAAEALGLSTRTVDRLWVYAKAWLRDALAR